eukprot:2530900-Alexandrium_andersonii.AAC.1
MSASLVGSEMCIRDSLAVPGGVIATSPWWGLPARLLLLWVPLVPPIVWRARVETARNELA